MPLALQALLPLAILVAASIAVRLRPRRQTNGWIAAGATAVAALIAFVELLRLAPGEHVDVPYLTTFPYADLLIRLDGLSLAFVGVTLLTAALLMIVRQYDREDRRDPWTGWLLTSAAVCALLLAGNLLLLYALLQVVTLTWSGALQETAPRRLRLRLLLQISDIGLLLAAASAIQSVGTSSYSGVPSDTFGVATFWLMLLPVLARLVALASAARAPIAAALFAPAIAWLAPAGYLLLRLLALMGGRLPDRPTAVVLFLGGALGAIALGIAALWARSGPRLTSLLLAAQAALALALSSAGEPLATVACTWLWLLLIPLAGLVSVRIPPGSIAETLTRWQLSLLPASLAFGAIWLLALTLNGRGLPLAVVPLALAVAVAAAAALPGLRLAQAWPRSPAAIWAAALLLIAAIPGPIIDRLVIPAASTARLVPAGTIGTSPLGLMTALGPWPALLVSLVVLAAVAISGRAIATLPAPRVHRPAFFGRPTMTSRPPWDRWPVMRRVIRGQAPIRVLWAVFSVVILVALIRL